NRTGGARRGAPPAPADGACPVEPPVERRRPGAAASSREGRERDLSGVGQLALHDLPLDLEPDQEEEHGHQAVVDPEDQGLRDYERPDPDLDGCPEKRMIDALGARVGEDEPGGRRDHEQDTARRLEPQELANGVGGPATRLADVTHRHHDPSHERSRSGELSWRLSAETPRGIAPVPGTTDPSARPSGSPGPPRRRAS